MARKHAPLGQHFLTAKGTVLRLVEALTAPPHMPIIEIGPGTGVVTRELLSRFDRVVAIEKDVELAAALSHTFAAEIASGQLRIIVGDALDFDPRAYGITEAYAVVGNIPYYITGALFRLVLTHDDQPTEIAFLIQREVAERIVERDGKRSILSLSVAAYGTPKIISHVKPGAFNPPPAVDSSILYVGDISRTTFTDNTISETTFFTLVKTGFAHKRKKLQNNIDVSADVLESVGIDPDARAEDVPLTCWIALTRALYRT